MRINYLVPPKRRPIGAAAQAGARRAEPRPSATHRVTHGAIVALAAMLGTANSWAASPNIVEQWNKIAEDTVVGSGAFQPEGLIYMSYVSAAVYNATVAINGKYAPLGPPIPAAPGSSS